MRHAVVISHRTYPEPAFIARLRDRYGDELPSVLAFDDLAAARATEPALDPGADLTALLVGADPASVAVVAAEITRLRQVEDDRLDALATAAWRAAASENPELGRTLVRLTDDTYVAWAGGADAPSGWVMTAQDALDAGFPPERIRAAVDATADGERFNRAGPGEACLTAAAIIEAYSSQEARQAFRLTPDKIRPYTTSEMTQNPATGEWEHSEPYWVPWAPDAVPATLPATMRETF